MAINLRTVENTEFEWTWPKDAEVRCRLVPCTTRVERQAARTSGISVDTEGFTKVASQVNHIVELVSICMRAWEGVVGPDGEKIKPTRENVAWVMEQSPEFVLDSLDAARSKYAEMIELSGKSQTPPSGTSRGSTAKPVSFPVNYSLPASVRVEDAG